MNPELAYTLGVVSSRASKAFPFLCLAIFLMAIDLMFAFVAISQRNQTIATDKVTVKALQATNKNLDTALANAKSQHQFTIWNSCGTPCTIGPSVLPSGKSNNPVRVGGVPDTFDLILSFTSTTPVSVYFLTMEGWAQFDGPCNLLISCVDDQYHDLSLGPTSNLTDYTFKDAEGCATYVIVFQAAASGVITPNERINYNPASTPTGACA